MPRLLQQSERLIYAGMAQVRTPRGGIEETPQYIIAPEGATDPALAVPVETGEAVIPAGLRTRPGQKEAAFERYEAALRAGKKPTMPEDSAEALYIKVDALEISRKTGLLESEEAACREIVADMAERFHAATNQQKHGGKRNV